MRLHLRSCLAVKLTWFHSVQGMSNEDIQNLQKVVDEQIQENMGMSMIYTIVSAAQEWMQDKVCGLSCTAVLAVSPILHAHASSFVEQRKCASLEQAANALHNVQDQIRAMNCFWSKSCHDFETSHLH